MRRSVCFTILFFLLKNVGYSQSYGLQFSSHEAVQEKRTSLNLSTSESICFKNDAEISFDLSFAPLMETYFGYIFRLITTDNQNIDLIYNQRFQNFNFIIGETVSGTFTIDSLKLYKEWNRITLVFKIKEHDILFYAGNRFIGKGKVKYKDDLCFKLSFGTSSFDEFQTADLPPMSIRDIRMLENGKTKYYWPLSETSGETGMDSSHGKSAKVTNPVWIRPRYQNWELTRSFRVNGSPSVAFDPRDEKIFLVTTDSVFHFPASKGQLSGEKLAEKGGDLLAGNQSVYSPLTNKLFNVYIDQRKVRTYHPETRKWDLNFVTGPLTEFWHANKFFSYGDSSLYTIGGYGQLRYKNIVQRYRFPEKRWDTVKTEGDILSPRYLAALGATHNGDTAYIIGGYGSNTGDQMVNPKYNYDLLEYRVKERTFRTLYHFKEPDSPFCFANSLILDTEAREYYALIFANDKFNSKLQLIRGSLGSPGYTLLGDPIPYNFYDVRSFADLYYSPVTKKLVAVTLYTSKDTVTDVKIYTIAFPPNQLLSAVPVAEKSFPWRSLILVLLVTAAGIYLFFRFKKKAPQQGNLQERNPQQTNHQTEVSGQGILRQGTETGGGAALPISETGLRSPAIHSLPANPVPQEGETPKSTIFLFGSFELYDKEGHDLTKLFTPLLKELYLLIGIYSLRSGKGISSEKLYSTLWRDKSNKDAQNNRSVNMVKLKAILDKLGPCGIVKEGDKWIFQYDPDQIRIDLAEFLPLLPPAQLLDKDNIRKLLKIINRGAFLTDTDYPWLEDIKSEISGKALDLLSGATLQFSTDAELLLEISNGLFLFDSINEDALRIKCKSLSLLGRHSLAKATFEKFAKEYQQMYGEDFQQTFHEVIS
ncbi:hypothetical protein ACX0G9_16255 [Flavitalea flava]